MPTSYTGAAGRAYFHRYQAELLSDAIGRRRAQKLNAYLDPNWSVVDFGCAAGQATVHLRARQRTGVEVNETAVRHARQVHGLRVVSCLGELPAAAFDAVVTHHVLEHVDDPLAELRQIVRVLKPGGRLVAVVPGETGWYRAHNHWRAEINKHLYAWTPLTLGNLCVAAGFTVETARPLRYAEPSRFLGPLNRLPGTGAAIGWLRQVFKGETEVLVVARKAIQSPTT